MLFMHYTGEFRYQRLDGPLWQAVEIVKLDASVLRRLLRSQPGLFRALGEEWLYQGTQGLHKLFYVYRRRRTLPVRLPPNDTTVSVVDQVEVPHIDLGSYELIPDAASTMRFEGPRPMLRGTSPNARPESFAGLVAYTLRVGELVQPPRLEIGHPTTPAPSFGQRLINAVVDFADLTYHALTSLIGLIIATAVVAAVTAIAGPTALDAWKRRRNPAPDHTPP
jgi:hypothetical protein